jgi:hypothetical protein
MRFRGITEEGETIEFQNYCKDSDNIIEYGSELGVHKGIWKYVKKYTLVCLEVESLERQLKEAMEIANEVIDNGYFERSLGLNYIRRYEELKYDQQKGKGDE